jgi:hypothetical protein
MKAFAYLYPKKNQIAMKQLMLVLAMLSMVIFVKAQTQKPFSVHLGYHLNYVSPKSLNYVIDRYNGTRSDLDEEMKNIKALSGPTLGLSYNSGATEIRLQGLVYGAQVNAIGADSMNVSTRRDLGMFAWTASLGMSQRIAEFGDFVSLRLGGAFSVTGLQTETKVGPTDQYEKDVPLDEIFSEVKTGIMIFAPVRVKFTEWMSLSAEPFFELNFNGFDATEVNKAINPATYQEDAVENVKGPFNYPGVNFALIFSI